MGRKSSIDLLPAEFKDALHALLRDPRFNQLEITRKINTLMEQAGAESRLSQSAVNRYALRMENIGAKLKQSRQIADLWIGKLGNEPQGQVGQLLNEVVRNLAFDTAMSLSDEEEAADPKLIKELAIAIEKLEKAASDNEKRTAQIRKQTREDAAEELKEGLKNEGISVEVEESIRRILLGK